MTTTVLELQDVRKVHGTDDNTVVALDGVTLTLRRGEFVAVMGTSGSGKSTLLNIAGGLDSPTSGSVIVEGQPLGDLRLSKIAALRRQHIGYVFQSLNLIPSLTAVENVMLPRELDGVRSSQARREAEAALAEVGVSEISSRFPEDLSGGQQQRIAIARALVGSRRLILADEPTGSLDSATGDAVMRLIRSRCDDGASAIVVTHDARHAGWADHVLFLRDGRPACIAASASHAADTVKVAP